MTNQYFPEPSLRNYQKQQRTKDGLIADRDAIGPLRRQPATKLMCSPISLTKQRNKSDVYMIPSRAQPAVEVPRNPHSVFWRIRHGEPPASSEIAVASETPSEEAPRADEEKSGATKSRKMTRNKLPSKPSQMLLNRDKSF